MEYYLMTNNYFICKSMGEIINKEAEPYCRCYRAKLGKVKFYVPLSLCENGACPIDSNQPVRIILRVLEKMLK